MAGIGFKLQRLLQSDSYISKMSAYAHGVFISCGPWLMSIVVIVGLGNFQSKNLTIDELELFRVSIVYCYMGSLIVYGLFQMPLTRYLADLHFQNNLKAYLPTFVGASLVTFAIVSMLGIPACFFANDWPPFFRFQLFLLFQTVASIWLSMTFISAAKDYYSITWSFIIGGILSIGCGIWLGQYFGLNGYVAGYTIGQFLILMCLIVRIMIEFPSKDNISFEFLKHCKTYPLLVGVGFLYNVGIWVDKLMFWFNPVAGQQIDNFLHASFIYDQPFFLAYLTIIPTFTIFLVKMETNFYQYYKGFYDAISEKKSLPEIVQYKEAMIANSMDNTWFVVKVQAFFSFIPLLLAPKLVTFLRIDWYQMIVFRITIIAAFVQGLLLILIIYFMYFDFQKETFYVTLFFCGSNILFTLITLILGFPFYGMGYLLACISTLIFGVYVLVYKMKRLEYLTFMNQPY